MIPAGKHPVRILSVQLGATDKDVPQIVIGVEHTSEAHSGARATWYGSLVSDSSTALVIKTLRGIGWTGDDITDVQLPEGATGTAVYADEVDNNGNAVVRFKYLNGSDDAREVRPLADDKRAEVRDRVRLLLGSATSAPAVSEKLRPFLAEVNKVGDATAAARLWKTFGDKITTWSKDDQNTAWSALCQRAEGKAIKAALDALKKPVAAPVANGSIPTF